MRRALVCAFVCLAGFRVTAGWVQRPVLVHAPFASPVRVRGPSTRQAVKEPSPALGRAYSVAGVTTIAAWIACAIVALTGHPTLKLPVRHQYLTIAQALTPVPLAASVFTSLSRSAGKEGWWAMGRSTYRRLNLGVAAVSLWLAAAAIFGPSFCAGYKLYSANFVKVISATHFATALFCLTVWVRVVNTSPPTRALGRLVRGIIGSIWGLIPQTSETGMSSSSGSASQLDDPDSPAGSDGRNEYAVACALFVWFAVVPNLVGFPLATVPTILGRSLSRAASAWTLLAAVVAYVLKDASQRGRIHSGTTFRYLRYGMIASSGAHLLLIAMKLGGIDGGRAALSQFYPGALACPKVALASLLMHCLVVFAALTPPAKVAKKASTAVAVSAPASSDSTTAAAAAVAADAFVPATASKLEIGKRVSWNGTPGTVRYIGEIALAPGEWIGVELDSGKGQHDGTVMGKKYFSCSSAAGGVFAKQEQLQIEA